MVNFVDKIVYFDNTFIGAVPLPNNCYNNNHSPTYIYDLNYAGVESNIWDCPYEDNYHYGSHYQDAAVICQCKWF